MPGARSPPAGVSVQRPPRPTSFSRQPRGRGTRGDAEGVGEGGGGGEGGGEASNPECLELEVRQPALVSNIAPVLLPAFATPDKGSTRGSEEAEGEKGGGGCEGGDDASNTERRQPAVCIRPVARSTSRTEEVALCCWSCPLSRSVCSRALWLLSTEMAIAPQFAPHDSGGSSTNAPAPLGKNLHSRGGGIVKYSTASTWPPMTTSAPLTAQHAWIEHVHKKEAGMAPHCSLPDRAPTPRSLLSSHLQLCVRHIPPAAGGSP
jgi:hypothetical protein